jgi:hypothetical protein
MNPANFRLQRLLQAAAKAEERTDAPVPFGFDTRVVALWRAAGHKNGGNGVVQLVRRVALLASIILVAAGAASFREMRVAEDIAEPTSNEYAIADIAIEDELYQ